MTIEKLKYLLARARTNPRYLLYYWQNAYFLRSHFPFIYDFFHSFKRPKTLYLGARNELHKLHVILRTTDCVMSINGPELS